MKKFIYNLFIFSIILSPLPFLLDHLITDSLQKSRRFNFSEWNDLFSDKIRAELVVYGSSRAWRHFDTKLMEDEFRFPVYNLGIDGYQFHMQYARHKILMREPALPKYIVLSLDYWTLAKTNDLYMSEQFLPYLNDTTISQFTKAYNGLDFWDYNLPFVRYFGRTKYIIHALDIQLHSQKNYNVKYKGFQGNDAVWQQDIRKAVEVMRVNNALLNNKEGATLDFGVDSLTQILFQQFLIEMNQKGIKVCLVVSPIYVEGQNYVSGHSDFIKKFKKYAETYNCTFLDYSSDSICYNKKYFYNSTHLNSKGAALFTKKFTHDFKMYTK